MEFDRCFLFSRLKSTMWETLPFTGSCKRYWNPPQHHIKPRFSQCCSLTRSAWPKDFPCKASQAGAPYPSPAQLQELSQHRPPGANLQPPNAPSLRSHPDSLYMPCTSPECWLHRSNPSVQVRPEGLPNLGGPQHPLSLFIRDTAFQQKHIAGKEGEKPLHTRTALLSMLNHSETILASMPQGQPLQLLAFTRLDS